MKANVLNARPTSMYEMVEINSRDIVIPDAYKRRLNTDRVAKIAAGFDECIANEPKASQRDGRYYVFDGQHTIAARKKLNRNADLPILCKVYRGITEHDESLLFAAQTGESAALTPSAKLRARLHGISAKRRISNKIKGNACEPMGQPPYGYIKDPEDPKHWVVDEEATRVIRRIYGMTLEGVGTEQIATQLKMTATFCRCQFPMLR